MDVISTTLDEMFANFLKFIPDLIVAIVIFIISLYGAGLLTKVLRSTMERRKTDPELRLLTDKITRWSIITLGVFAALQHIGFNLSAFLAGLGILGFTVGFALQDVSKNFVAGLLLLFEQPFDIGDVIEVGDFLGTVANVEIRATEIYTFDGQNVIIPNADVFANPIKNYSRYPKRRLELTAGVAYSSDLDLVRKTVLEVIATIPGVLFDPAPRVIFNNFGDTTIDFIVYYWVDLEVGDYLDSIDLAFRGINTAFSEKGIEMPYPVRTILLENKEKTTG